MIRRTFAERKAALLESETTAVGGLDWLVAGIGVNVAAHPPGSEYPTTSLHGILSELRVYNRALTDVELIHEMSITRRDLTHRGIALP